MRLAFGPEYISRLFTAYTGIDVSPREMMITAERLFNLFKAYAVRQGLTRKNDHWPDRFYEEPLSEGPARGSVLSRDQVDKLLDGYYEIRGWDRKTGLPTGEKLVALDLNEVAEDLQNRGILT